MSNNLEKLEKAEELVDIFRKDISFSADDYGKVLNYRYDLRSRQNLYEMFTEDGEFNIWTRGTKRDKQELNSLSYKIMEFESWLLESPLSEELKEKYNIELPDFLNELDTPPDEISTPSKTNPGWYQDKNGNLYSYDGVIWDEVPPMPIKDLEYLSGE